MSADPLLELGKQILAQQPFSTLLGTELTMFTADQAELQLPMRPELKQQHGFAHGGVLSYLADNALTFAGGAALAGDVVTGEYKINYLRPATGNTLVARAKVLRAGKVHAVCQCEVFAVTSEGEKLCAFALGTINKR